MPSSFTLFVSFVQWLLRLRSDECKKTRNLKNEPFTFLFFSRQSDVRTSGSDQTSYSPVLNLYPFHFVTRFDLYSGT